MSEQIIQGFMTPDGQSFPTKKAAQKHLRRPKVKSALLVVTGNNEELANWLQDNEEDVVASFDIGTIKRVTNTEKKQLAKALEALKETTEPKLAFIRDNADAIEESFRWPKVARMSDEEKASAARNSLVALSDGQEDLADWCVANKDAVLEAYQAGVEKKAVNPKAAAALAEYRRKKAEEKAKKEAKAG